MAQQSAPKSNVNWEATEYITRDKRGGWYVGLVLVGLTLSAIAVWLQQWTFLALIVVSVVALIVYSLRPPRLLRYELSDQGLKEGNRLYIFSDYKAFGVLAEDKRFSIVLIPKKRFSAKVTVFFPEAQGEAIVDMFGLRLPMEQVKPDLLDKLVRFLRI